ncbi:phospholipase D domain protein [Marvinbryantia formatexigens DSM 14469]|uniref:Phospholipase D domain protein n=1 Tax=Marvinbryantia formatexigens DSM 14469 TaxID=478749 RepID=C6LAA9_9FIRM|nr:phospholipase D family protein [Marvinbryantia formatexigens]EET62516.1 phospholipase D domain protein [Marvinbryantia formatexigens DSM 14469]UWO24959.1 phospholipase D family protein [Marvinbryantia formatexigens DSM 14469]SDG25332.1 Phosphatidylserine/phosphatidylglycerophosphate/cardiolipin synthase [Marvinbryantia formatexigens]
MIRWIRGKYVPLLHLTAGILAVILTGRYPVMCVLLAVYAAAIAVMLLEELFLRKRSAERVSHPDEKKCMAVLGIAMLLCMFLPADSFFIADILACAGMAALVVEALLRAMRCVKMRHRRVLTVVLVCYIAGGAILPFAHQPSVMESTEKAFAAEDFYGDGYSGERAKVIAQNGEALKERIRLIEQAQEEIILSTLEFDADTSGKQVLAALMAAAERGVKISILTDGMYYLMQVWGNPYFLALAQMEQVEIKAYNTPDLLRPWTAMGRLHDKYLIADDFAYILGGRNTYDYFLGDQPGYKNYDWDVLVYREADQEPQMAGAKEAGDTDTEKGYKASLFQVKDYFTQVWNSKDCRLTGESRIWSGSSAVLEARAELEELYETMKQEHGDWFETPDYEAETLPATSIRLVSNPIHIFSKEPVVYYTITELMKQAEEEVVFHTPYIVCNDWMLERLRQVCAGEAEVWMMTNSVANNGNPFGAMDYQKYKGKILDTGVRIMEYDGGISYHGKCFVIDDNISAIGSFNWDMRSAYLDTELMLVIDSEPLNRALREEMGNYEKDALQVLSETEYELAQGQVMQEISTQRRLRIMVLGPLLGWARFLM